MSRKAFSAFYDRIAHTMLKAPDRYRPDTGMTLEKAFFKLNIELEESKSFLGDNFDSIKNHLDLSLAVYKSSDIREGIKNLQAIDVIIEQRIAK